MNDLRFQWKRWYVLWLPVGAGVTAVTTVTAVTAVTLEGEGWPLPSAFTLPAVELFNRLL